MMSTTYQLTSTPAGRNAADLKYHSHYIARRLPAEVILDAISQVTGVGEDFPGFPGRRAMQLPDAAVDSYFLSAFGRPPRLTAADSERQQEPSITQALHVINGDTINRKLSASRGLIHELVTTNADNKAAIERIYLAALSRYPSDQEVRALSTALDAASPASARSNAARTPDASARRKALEDLGVGDPDGTRVPLHALSMDPFRSWALAAVAAAGIAGLSVGRLRAAGRRRPSARQPRTGVSFSQVRAILRDSCEHCHNEETAENGLVLKSYDTLIAGGDSGNPIVPGKSASSLLVQAIEGRVKPRMPYKEDPLSPADIDTIRRWIDAGAPGPSAAEAASDEAMKVEIPDVRPTVSVSGPVSAVAFDVTTRRIAVGSYKSVHLLSFDDRKWSGSLDGHADLVRALAFSADGTRLAAAGGASGRVGEVRIWDVRQAPARSIATIQGHKDAILSVAFSPDGSTVATGSYDKLVKLWDAATGKELRTLKEHSDAVYSVAFLPGGTQLVSGAGDRTLKIWDVQQRHAPLHDLRRARCRLRRGRSPLRLETRRGWRRSHDPHLDLEWRYRLGRRSGRHAADVGVRPRRCRPRPRLLPRRDDARLGRRRSHDQDLGRVDAGRETAARAAAGLGARARVERRRTLARGRTVRRHARSVFARERRGRRAVRAPARWPPVSVLKAGDR